MGALITRFLRGLTRWIFFGLLLCLLLFFSLRWINPPISMVQYLVWRDAGTITRSWVPLETLPGHVPAAFVAAEDAKFCAHWGFDIEAIQAVLDTGARRGASTITQQTIKNLFLWPQRSWLRKGVEAGLTPLAELLWGKRRILEIYLNIAQTDATIFGVEAGTQSYFGKPAAQLSAAEAARLASVLPSPGTRSAARPNANQQRRLRTIQIGAAAISNDHRGACFKT